VALGMAAIAVLLAASAAAGRMRLPHAWVVLGVPGFALFLGFTFGVFLPSLAKPWPAPRIAEAIEPLRSCVQGPVGIVGFREPSAKFVLGAGAAHDSPGRIASWAAERRPGIALVEQRWHDALLEALGARGTALPERVGCVEAFNVMRGCSLAFSVYVTGGNAGERCKLTPEFSCQSPVRASPTGQPRASRCH
jgi:hypothetical protein